MLLFLQRLLLLLQLQARVGWRTPILYTKTSKIMTLSYLDFDDLIGLLAARVAAQLAP